LLSGAGATREGNAISMRFRQALAAVVMAPIAVCFEARSQERPLFSTDTELVVLHVTVKDRRGAYVGGLPREAFTILENGRPQAIELFTNQDAPATIGLLVDSSGSMQPHRALVIAAATAFAGASHPQDELFALGFNEGVRSVLPESVPFTSNAAVLREALTRGLTARGTTALYDAISAGLEYLGHGQEERKVLVVVSDGGDNASSATLRDLLARIRSSNTLIYTVGLVDVVSRDSNPKVLQQIAQATGGDLFVPTDARQMTRVLLQIARDIRNSYTMGYVPSDVPRDGAFHQLRVGVQSPDRQPVIVRTRTGYVASSVRAQ
jgi:Ca-activated chloride channel family protein